MIDINRYLYRTFVARQYHQNHFIYPHKYVLKNAYVYYIFFSLNLFNFKHLCMLWKCKSSVNIVKINIKKENVT